jgi:uncharacterized protein (DUF433 family)
MSEIHRITVDPGRCGGRPCLRGLRILVRDVLDRYPSLKTAILPILYYT